MNENRLLKISCAIVNLIVSNLDGGLPEEADHKVRKVQGWIKNDAVWEYLKENAEVFDLYGLKFESGLSSKHIDYRVVLFRTGIWCSVEMEGG